MKFKFEKALFRIHLIYSNLLSTLDLCQSYTRMKSLHTPLETPSNNSSLNIYVMFRIKRRQYRCYALVCFSRPKPCSAKKHHGIVTNNDIYYEQSRVRDFLWSLVSFYWSLISLTKEKTWTRRWLWEGVECVEWVSTELIAFVIWRDW